MSTIYDLEGYKQYDLYIIKGYKRKIVQYDLEMNEIKNFIK